MRSGALGACAVPSCAVLEPARAFFLTTGLGEADAEAFALSGGCVTVLRYEGSGWATVAMGMRSPASGGAGAGDDLDGVYSSGGVHSGGHSGMLVKLVGDQGMPGDAGGSDDEEEDGAGVTYKAHGDGGDDFGDDDDFCGGGSGSNDEGGDEIDRTAAAAAATSLRRREPPRTWRQVFHVGSETTIAAFRAAVSAAVVAPLRLHPLAAGAGGAGSDAGSDAGAAVDRAAGRGVVLVFAGRPLVRCRVPAPRAPNATGAAVAAAAAGGLAAIGEEDAAIEDGYAAELAEEAFVTLEDTLIKEVESRVGTGQASASGAGANPRALCYLCGTATASPASLAFHAPKCLARWRGEQAMLPEFARRASAPKPPAGFSMTALPSAPGPLLDAWNRAAALTFILDVIPRCKGCGKGFGDPMTLHRHTLRCSRCGGAWGEGSSVGDGSGGGRSGSVGGGHGDESASMSEAWGDAGGGGEASLSSGDTGSHVLCYICNRYTGLASAAWHLKACAARFEARQLDGLPLALRRPLADPPGVPLPTEAFGSKRRMEALAAYNAEARRVHDQEVKPRCPACGLGVASTDDDECHYPREDITTGSFDAAGSVDASAPGGGLVAAAVDAAAEAAHAFSCGGSVAMQRHMATCCPDVLRALQNAAAPSRRALTGFLGGDDRGVATWYNDEASDGVRSRRPRGRSPDGGGAGCVVCGRRVGLAGYVSLSKSTVATTL